MHINAVLTSLQVRADFAREEPCVGLGSRGAGAHRAATGQAAADLPRQVLKGHEPLETLLRRENAELHVLLMAVDVEAHFKMTLEHYANRIRSWLLSFWALLCSFVRSIAR